MRSKWGLSEVQVRYKQHTSPASSPVFIGVRSTSSEVSAQIGNVLPLKKVDSCFFVTPLRGVKENSSKFYCLPREILLPAQRNFTTCPCSKNGGRLVKSLTYSVKSSWSIKISFYFASVYQKVRIFANNSTSKWNDIMDIGVFWTLWFWRSKNFATSND